MLLKHISQDGTRQLLKFNKLEGSSICNACELAKQNCLLVFAQGLLNNIIVVLCDECIEKMLFASKPDNTKFNIEWHHA